MTEPALMPLVEYGKSRGLTENQSRVAVARGALPALRIGRLFFVAVRQADRALGLAGDPSPSSGSQDNETGQAA